MSRISVFVARHLPVVRLVSVIATLAVAMVFKGAADISFP